MRASADEGGEERRREREGEGGREREAGKSLRLCFPFEHLE